MGQTVLQDFHARLGLVAKEAGIEKDLFTLYVNAAYFEVVGANEFDQFKEDVEFTFDADENSILIPEGTLAILSIVDMEEKAELLYTNPEVFRRHLPGSGVPKKWTQIGNEVFIWGTPTSDTTLTGITLKEPDRLILEGDRTALPTTWDEAIFLLAAEKLLRDLDEFARADSYASRAIMYMQSRTHDSSHTMRRQSEGFNVIRDERELRAMKEYS